MFSHRPSLLLLPSLLANQRRESQQSFDMLCPASSMHAIAVQFHQFLCLNYLNESIAHATYRSAPLANVRLSLPARLVWPYPRRLDFYSSLHHIQSISRANSSFASCETSPTAVASDVTPILLVALQSSPPLFCQTAVLQPKSRVHLPHHFYCLSQKLRSEEHTS